MRLRAKIATCWTTVAVVATLLAGCPEDASLRLTGSTCETGGECATGLCGGGQCLDPTGDDDGDGLINQFEVEIGTDPTVADTDGDGISDKDELTDTLDIVDTDGDGIQDAVESRLIDADGDCIPDQYDARNDIPDDDYQFLVDHYCALDGVCGAQKSALKIVCVGGVDIVACDYDAVVGYEVDDEQTCDSLDNDCDGLVDEGAAAAACAPKLVTLVIAPAAPRVALGRTTSLTATATWDDDSQTDATATARWASDDNTTATVDDAGVVTPVAVGTVSISASLDDLTARVTLAVDPAELTALALNTSAVTVAAGLTVTLSAEGTYSDGTIAAPAGVVWTSSDDNISTVAAGVVTGVTAGDATVTATVGSIEASATVKVTAAEVTTVTVSGVSLEVPERGMISLTATAAYTDGDEQDVTADATWSSLAPATATVGAGSSGGVVNGVSAGSVDIKAAYGGTDGVARVLVLAATCSDSVSNGAETGSDCGGATSCDRCGQGQGCGAGSDCLSGVCDGTCQAPACDDGATNGAETDEDCGGDNDCDRCAANLMCNAGADCVSGVCNDSGRCAATCSDAAKNQGETDVDCGGGICKACTVGDTCVVGTDCDSLVCVDGTCRGAGCGDKKINGEETDADCGGSDCGGCDDGLDCLLARDCLSGVCTDDACQAPACDDNVSNGAETDEDCGGEDCDGCADGLGCLLGGDCESGVCVDGSCQVPVCDDNATNGAETDEDCGGEDCDACADELACALPRDCESGVCTDETCRAPTCSDRVTNGAETDEDCGGGGCPTCEDGDMCDVAGDCDSGVCDGGICQVPDCDDDALNGDETDLNCGGATCGACADTLLCKLDRDCLSRVCDGDRCAVPACDDKARNGDETDLNCGGSLCDGCGTGKACGDPTDCLSGVCEEGTCQAPTCGDDVLNQDESDKDCGGKGCDGCLVGQLCNTGGDCVTGACDVTCQEGSCDDDIPNGEETDEDCGGPTCDPCADGLVCALARDCESGVCEGGKCQVPSCEDKVSNGAESGVDCGGPKCDKCVDGQVCGGPDDCLSGVCAGTCQAPTCDDDVTNGAETDLNCGGPVCDGCVDGDVCELGRDCLSLVCEGDRCSEPACDDNVTNGDESDLNCGGDTCPKCVNGLACGDGEDCVSGVCADDVCAAPGCTDAVLNGAETDLNCGGGDCPKCNDTLRCDVDADCKSGVCSAADVPNGPGGAGTCKAPTCEDRAQNGAETDLNCGGGTCDRCADGATCGVDSDCLSGVCDDGVCQEPACGDRATNGAETDLNCGGDVCAPCPDGGACLLARDCVSDVCDGTCQVPTCEDMATNGAETDEDCGGGTCDDCMIGQGCRIGDDCGTGVCFEGECQAPLCDDKVHNGDETDKDCGGEDCDACADGLLCDAGTDCRSLVCGDNGKCQAPSCEDAVQNGTETDLNCGGTMCDGCADGLGCKIGDDCQSLVCGGDGTCAEPSCTDGRTNGEETDLNCGGSMCDPCADGKLCGAGGDCQSGVCGDDGVCAVPTCEDEVANGVETDVDCGGTLCGATCDPGEFCEAPGDCTSGVCGGDGAAGAPQLITQLPKVCDAPSCTDRTKNADETDVDCGGTACGATCDPGDRCDGPEDCVEGVCGDDGRCAEPTCDDGVTNQDESDLNCGGFTCDPCAVGATCNFDSDCVEGVCGDDGVCAEATCDDTVHNGEETDEDCGGAVCGATCTSGERCYAASDCVSGVCSLGPLKGGPSLGPLAGPTLGWCAPPSCHDEVQNQGETGVDCGGPCDGCAPGDGCVGATDCREGVCDTDAVPPVCAEPTCEDDVQNNGETDKDCGGPCGATCLEGDGCADGGDCIEKVCAADMTCAAPTCFDGEHNGDETDEDCGGGCELGCATGEGCSVGDDCAEGVCGAGDLCAAPTCDDGVQNQGETDTDCGGASCPGTCELDETCDVGADCVEGVCDAGACAAPLCDDEVHNGAETDDDCGGPVCGPTCGSGEMCDDGGDCTSSVCTDGTCASPGCDDNEQNGNETDTDCGGDVCPGCLVDEQCNVGTDCGSGYCAPDGTCQACLVHVDLSATQSGNGSSWGKALATLDEIPDTLFTGCEVWVSQGTVKGTDATAVLTLWPGVSYYGGFVGAETELAERPAGAMTTLDGAGVSESVVVVAAGSLLDGFLLTGGTGPDQGPGGAILANGAKDFTGRNLTIEGNTSPWAAAGAFIGANGLVLEDVLVQSNHSEGDVGGIFIDATSRATLTDVVFDGNTAGEGVGALRVRDTPRVDLTRVDFTDNSAADAAGAVDQEGSNIACVVCRFEGNMASDGGAILVSGASGLSVINSVFIDNMAPGGEGGAVRFKGFQYVAIFHYVTMTQNSATSGGALAGDGPGTPQLYNSVIWGNTPDDIVGPARVNYSVVPADQVAVGSNNIDAPPRFVDPQGGDFALRFDSPAIDTASDAAGLFQETDIAGTSRVDIAGVGTPGTLSDMGAWERTDVDATHCSSGGRDEDETAKDCGGGHCNPCTTGDFCYFADDCDSGVCTGNACVAATCDDEVANGGESDVDCGEVCLSGCPVGAQCTCSVGDTCGGDADCQTGYCRLSDSTCQEPTCNDHVANGDETDVDCGGSCVATCDLTEGCLVDGDCTSTFCRPSDDTCRTPTCMDTYQNQDETDEDCGGVCGATCDDDEGCGDDSDCVSGFCNPAALLCKSPTCSDTYMNQDETDVDCGGSCGATCEVDEDCGDDDDCETGYCHVERLHGQIIAKTCRVPTCTDGVDNGDESDVDCGGSCGGCANGDSCNVDSDCGSYFCEANACAPCFYFVDGGNGGQQGRSWADAVDHFDDLPTLGSGCEVWVTEGTYGPNGASEVLRATVGVGYYGGFDGTEQSRDDRADPPLVTMLNGEGTARNVVIGAADAEVNGFTITGGNSGDVGGGVHAKETPGFRLTEVIVSGNSGGGVYLGRADGGLIEDAEITSNSGGGIVVVEGDAISMARLVVQSNTLGVDGTGAGIRFVNSTDVMVEDADISANVVSDLAAGGPSLGAGLPAGSGGGVVVDGGSVTFDRARVYGNSAEIGGGGVLSNGAVVRFQNALITDNDATTLGGGLYLTNVTLECVNCTLAGNSAQSGAALYDADQGGTAQLTNSIVWSNGGEAEIVGAEVAASYSDVPQEYLGSGTSNISTAPLFADAANQDYRLWSASPCVDVANDAEATPYDVSGAPRMDIAGLGSAGVVTDMGAHDFAMGDPTVWFVDAAAGAQGDGLSWASPFKRLQLGLSTANPGDAVWVAEGTYRPTTMGDRAATFTVAGIYLLGGFTNGDELFERDPTNKRTILTCDLSGNDDQGYGMEENCYHVVFAGDDAWIDGFEIRGGNADGGLDDDYGGGVRAYQVNNLTLVNSFVTANRADEGGAGISVTLSDDVHLDTLIVTDNTTPAGQGGGIRIDRGARVIVEETTLSGNKAAFGGGIWLNQPDITLRGLTVDENEAKKGGGGVIANGVVTIEDSRFRYNNATDASGTAWGGALNIHSTARVEAYNSIFAKNDADTNGAGMRISNADVVLANVTVADNQNGSQQQGILRLTNGANLFVVNSIMYSVVRGFEELQILIQDPTESTGYVEYSDYDYLDSDVTVGPNNITDNPQFRAPGIANYKLCPGIGLFCGFRNPRVSPCIDGGRDDSPYSTGDDIDDQVRVDAYSGGAKSDMGASEYPSIIQ